MADMKYILYSTSSVLFHAKDQQLLTKHIQSSSLYPTRNDNQSIRRTNTQYYDKKEDCLGVDRESNNKQRYSHTKMGLKPEGYQQAA